MEDEKVEMKTADETVDNEKSPNTPPASDEPTEKNAQNTPTVTAPAAGAEPRERKKAPRSPSAPNAVSQHILEGAEENFMTVSPKEKATWIKMIKIRHATLVNREQDHKKWQDTMIQRRVDVYNRSKKLINAQRDRFRFLFKMTEVVKHLSENKSKENGNNNKDENNDNNDNNNDENINSNETNVEGNVSSNNTDIKEVEGGEIVEGDNSAPTIVVREPTQ